MIKKVLAALFTVVFIAIPAYAEQHEETVLNGNMVIDNTGMYSFVHYYKHPNKDITVALMGGTHSGTLSCMNEAKDILKNAHTVLYEGGPAMLAMTPEGASAIRNRLEEDYRALYDTNNPEAFASAVRLLEIFSVHAGGFDLEPERSILAHYFQNGTPADASFHERFKDFFDFFKTFNARFAKASEFVSKKQKEEVVLFARHAIQKSDEGKASLSIVGEQAKLFFGNPAVSKAILFVVFAEEREEAAVEALNDAINDLPSPATIAMRFGAAHLPGIRKWLEGKQFSLQRSEKLCLMLFNDGQ